MKNIFIASISLLSVSVFAATSDFTTEQPQFRACNYNEFSKIRVAAAADRDDTVQSIIKESLSGKKTISCTNCVRDNGDCENVSQGWCSKSVCFIYNVPPITSS